MTGTWACSGGSPRRTPGSSSADSTPQSSSGGLLVSLNQRGVVDLPYISQLYGKPEDAVIGELGDLVYLDPEAKAWQTADAYLSGNVRDKLVAAEKAGIARNVAALRAVQPEDVLPGDIDANLGAPWVPASDVQAFAAHLFGVEPSSITIAHMAKDAVWSVEGDWSAERAVAVTTDYGTARASGLWLLDLALNMKTPVIYDPDPSDPDKRVVNPEQIFRYVTEGSFDAYMWQALETKAKFINQIMTGESGVRRAEDVAGQELSYAEVKAIVSGNPAVLVLAEADAELQRLAVLRRNHADEQYLARKNLRDLPERIERLERRLAGLTADMATLATGGGLTVNGKPANEAALSRALTMIPDRVDWPRMYPVGEYKGLTFGIERHPGGAADVYLEGKAIRKAMLSRDSQGARAVTNALGRLESTYQEQCGEVRRELDITRGQLGDFEARLGRPFAHATYLDELTTLRDRLKLALSDTPPEGENATKLAEQIKELRAGHQVEAPKAKVVEARRPTPVPAPEPVTDAPVADEVAEKPVEEPVPTFRQRIGRGGQMSLF
jgi:hypothetical protein